MRWEDACKQSSKEVLSEMQTSLSGLSAAETVARLIEHGPNRVDENETNWWRILLGQFRSSFIYLLLVAASLSYLLGQHIEAIAMMVFLAIDVLLGFLQEYRSMRALALLKQYLISRTRVRRDGKEMLIESENVVPGDIVLLAPGEKAPADMRLIDVKGLEIDEEVLTGESVAVNKNEEVLSEAVSQAYKAENIVFAGTVAVRGTGAGVVLATGGETAMGEVVALSNESTRESIFEKNIQRFSRFIVRLVIATLFILFCVNVLIKGGEANILELLIFSIVLVVSVIPEALPLVMTVSLSRGSIRLAKKKVIVKRLSAIEDLGSVEVLCSDKTGTLTENNLRVDRVFARDRKQCFSAMALASDYQGLLAGKIVDPFDRAIWDALRGRDRKAMEAIDKVADFPFDPHRKRNSVVIRDGHSAEVIVRGAPEAIFDICDGMSEEDIDKCSKWMAAQGEDGRRVLAVANRVLEPGRLRPSHIGDEEKNLTFIGMISFVDPIKKTAKDAVDDARALGVAVKILTGDSKEVSGSVAYRIGLIRGLHEVMTGEELEALPYHKQLEAVHDCAVFARVSPKQKFEIIKLLQESKEVGFLGEGINDAPALKLANVALAVEGASDIARESADVILLDSSLHVIIDGIREGRSIFVNMVKYIKTTLASNFGNFYSVAVASLFVSFLPMLPLQILLTNLLSDFPMIALATDNADEDELRKPRSYNAKDLVLNATLLGIVSSIFDFIIFAMYYKSGEEVLQTNWFMLSIVTELLLVYSLRTKLVFWKAVRPSAWLASLSIVAGLAVFLIPYFEVGQSVFHLVRPDTSALLTIAGLAVAYFVSTEMVKQFYRRLTKV